MSRDADFFDPTPADPTPAELADVEALVRAAGDYVAPSDDLRPRVLETARARRRRDRRASRLSLAAAPVLTVTSAVGWRIEAAGDRLAEATTPRRIARLTAAEDASVERGGFDRVYWTLVDAFFTVRREQAESFGQAPAPADESAATREIEAQIPAADSSM